jgi:hypothetical protein
MAEVKILLFAEDARIIDLNWLAWNPSLKYELRAGVEEKRDRMLR